MNGRHLFLWVAMVVAAGGGSVATEPAVGKIREPAVAGLFYPREPQALAAMIDRCLAQARTDPAAASQRTGRLRALIVPHAGYEYSGPVAAAGYQLLRGTEFRTVVVLAPSHYALLTAASVSDAQRYRTPLGEVPISAKASELVQHAPYAFAPRVRVQAPGWAGQSSRARPPAGQQRADTWEHADEVQVPFLQRTLGTFALLPVVFGEVDPAEAARGLEPVLDDGTLVVVSSDLSHYHAYAEAQVLDRACIEAICALQPARMAGQEACGRMPILTLLHVAKHRGWHPVLLDYRNSGDTAGEKSSVVGYAAIAFYDEAGDARENESRPAQVGVPSSGVVGAHLGAPSGAASGAPTNSTVERKPAERGATYSREERSALLRLARETVRAVTSGERLPQVSADVATGKLAEPGACFVTLTEDGQLRGCIGHLTAQAPLFRSVIENARAAAIEDPRFLPVSPREVAQLEIEISVLTAPEPLAFSSPEDLLQKLQPHRDGVVLRMGSLAATYLPQVWEQIPDKVRFLDSLAEKAGARAGDWRRPGTSVAVYRVESFKESER